MSMPEDFSVPIYTLIKLCYSKALEWSSLVPSPEAKSSSSEITNPTSFTISYQDLPGPRTESTSLTQGLSSALQAYSLSLEPSGTPFMILKTIEYAQSFQAMYVILFVNIEIIILVKKLNNKGPFSWGSVGRTQVSGHVLPLLAKEAIPGQASEDLLPLGWKRALWHD